MLVVAARKLVRVAVVEPTVVALRPVAVGHNLVALVARTKAVPEANTLVELVALGLRRGPPLEPARVQVQERAQALAWVSQWPLVPWPFRTFLQG